jgi:RHS repeat-associated protein
MNYAYNGRGEQVRKHLGTSNTYTLYDEAGHWLGDYDGSGAPLQQALWMDDLPVGLLANGNQLHYIEPDHLGTPRVVIEVARNVPVWEWDAKGEVFGNTAPDQDPDGDGNLFVFDMRFPGQRFDAVSGLNYNYFRDYDSVTGRYAQSDPISLASDISTYRYAESSPNLFTDHFGLFGSPLEEKFPMPWDPQRCAEILRQIKTRRDEIGKRFSELDRNHGKLPNTASGPLKADRMGHITIINILDSQARKLEDDYDRHCRGPGPACPVPFSSPASAEDPVKNPQTAPAASIGTILLLMLVGYLAAST